MKKQLQFVNFEQAEKLKELGFDWDCLAFFDVGSYYPKNIYIGGSPHNWNAQNTYRISAPTVALALQWFREVKKIPNCISLSNGTADYIGVYQISNYGYKHTEHFGYDYYATESALLDKILDELLKLKSK
jgi:hypothetical protein